MTTPKRTIRFAAPEVAYAHHNDETVCVTTAIDVWAMGLILYELFTCEPLLDDSCDEAWLAERAGVSSAGHFEPSFCRKRFPLVEDEA